MGIGARPATCVSCGKRLNRKQWYYRHGKFFCKKRCWITEQAKVQQALEGAAQQSAKQSKETTAAS